MIAELRNQICLENDINSATDTYISFETIYSICLGNDNMVFRKGQFKKGHTINVGKKFSDEHKHKISIAHLGKLKSEKTKLKISTALKGKRGTWVGRKHTAETKEKQSDIKKGKKLSDETKRKMSASQKGRKHTEETKNKIAMSSLKHIHSEETKAKLSQLHIGKKLSEEHKKKISLGGIGRRNTEETKRKMSEKQLGDKGNNWQGGLSYLPYCHKFNRKLKERIRERDNRTCQLCGVKENGHKHHVHHIHYDKTNCYPDLVTLCLGCHSKVNGNRNYWEQYFMDILRNRQLISQVRL